jgi:hypothetical protein
MERDEQADSSNMSTAELEEFEFESGLGNALSAVEDGRKKPVEMRKAEEARGRRSAIRTRGDEEETTISCECQVSIEEENKVDSADDAELPTVRHENQDLYC